MKNFWKMVFCLALLMTSITAASAIQIGRTTTPEFFVDSNNNSDYNCNYVCYAITNNSATSYNSVWVTIGSFGGGVVTLASTEDGQVNLGPMAPNSVKYAYFFLQALTKTGPAQTHTITVYNGLPSLGNSLGSANFSLALTGIISASANKVTAIVTGPTPPTLGGLVTITVDGDSGTISSTKRWAFSAASLPTWDPGAYELYECVVTLSGCGCPNDGLKYTNNFNFVTPDNNDTHWQAIYKLRAVNTTTTPTAVTPIADISSGGSNMKYTTPSSLTGFAPIALSTNGLTLINESVSCGGVSATGTNITITLTLSNSSPNDAFMDAFVVTLSGSPTNATYVNSSSKTNGVSYADPSISSTSSNQVLTWSGYFLVPGNGTRNLSFQAAIPSVFGGYTNSAYATIGTNRIDTTLNLGDNSPAICSYRISPLADVQVTKSGPTNAFAFTNLTYTLTVTNLGPSTSSNLVVVDQLPTNVTFVSASSSGFLTNGQVKWTNFLVFTNGQTTNLTVTVTTPSSSGNITNVGSASAVTADPVTGNNDGTATNAIVITAIAAQADVKTTKTGPTNVFAGTNFSYTITLTNSGPSTASSITVTDAIPSGVSFISATGGGILTNGIVKWTVASLTNGASSNLTLQVTAPANSGTLTNIVSSGSIDFDPVPANNNGTATNAIVLTTITPQTDLQVSKSGTNVVFAGTNFTYTITLTNMGPSTASSITVTDTLPTGVTFSNATAGYTLTNGLLTWPIASFTNGASTNFSVTVIAPNNSATLTNRVSAGGIEFDPVSTNNNGTAANAIVTTIVTPKTDLQVTKSGTNNVFAGTNFTYTITLTNMGPSTASSITVTDTLPSGVTFSNATAGYTLTNGILTWPIASFTNGATTNFSVTVIAPNNSATLTNRVSAGGFEVDPVPGNNDGTSTNAIVTTTVTPLANLQATKVGTNNVFAGTNFTYTITLTNMGPSTASSITVTDTLPTGVTFSSATAGYTLTNGLLTWPIASFTNGATTNFSVTVIAPNNSATLTNRVSAGGAEFDPVSTNNNATAANAIVTTTVTPLTDLQTTKTGPATVFAGTNFTYTISLTNMGPSTASSISVTDTLPSGVTFSTASAGFTLTNGLVTWSIASFTNGATTNFSVTVIAPNNSATITNRVSSGGFEFDPVSTNNNGTAANAIVTTTVTPQADLQVSKTGTNVVFAGTNFSYTITLTNIGPSTASSITVTDALPTGVTFSSATPGYTLTNGFLTWPIATFTNGASTNFTVTVIAPNDSATLTNRVLTGGAEFDPVSTNNNGTAANAIVTTTVTPQANLQSTKTGPANVFAGTNFSYTITLTNMGPSTASSITVTDTLPLGVTFSSATAGYTLTNGVLTWPIASLTNGGSSNLTVTVTAPASGTLTNRVSSGSPIFDPTPGNNDGTAPSAIVTTTITPQADLQLIKTGPTNVFAGTNFSYTITLTNSGPSTATSLVVTDALPAGVTFVTGTAGYSVTNGIVTWPVASFTNGATTNFSIMVTAPANASTFTNIVSGGSSTFDPVFNNNDGSAAGAKVITAVTPVADIQTTKIGPTNVFAGTNFTYTIAVTNIGPSTAANITISDVLPTGVTFVSATGGGIPSSSNVVWQIASFTNSAFTNFSLTVTAPANAGTITNIVSSTSDTIDPVPVNNNGSAAAAIVVTTITPQSDLASGKTGPANVLAATNFNYTISVTNFGPSTVSSVVVTDTLPAEVTFVSATGGGSLTNGQVIWPIASLTNGAVTNLTVTVTAPASGTVTNYVSSGSPIFDPVPVNNNGSAPNAAVTTTITPLADLQAFKSGPGSVYAATNFSYTITLTNSGPSTAAGVVVTDALPAGVTFVTASASYSFTNGLITWPIATLTNGATTNLTVTVTAPANGATLTNRVSAGGTTMDLTPGNNDGTATNAVVTTTVIPLADLQAMKTGPSTVFAATNFSYTISVTNAGPSIATSMVVTDALPSGVTFVTASGGFTYTNGVVTWPFANFASGASTNLSVTVTAPPSGTLTNRVSTGSPILDLIPNNNDGSASNAVVTTTVTPVADVQTTKSGPTTIGAGTNFVYTISVTNAGPSSAANITVLDSLPPGVDVINVSGGGVATTNSVTWSALVLTNGGATNLTITVKAYSGPITNIVSSTSDTIDPVPANNDGTSPSARVVTTVAVGVAVSGYVYNDANQNGFRDTSEAGTSLTLYTKIFPTSTPTGPAIQAVAVNPTTGFYSFSNISVGTYVIIVDDNNTLSDVAPNIPGGWTGIESPAQIRNNIPVNSTAVPNQNFGLIQAVTLKGNVFKDTGASGGTANDGIKNGSEAGIASVIVKLTDSTGGTTYSTTTTAGDGSYTLTIPGSVTNGVQLKVVESNLTGYRSVGASVGNTGGTYTRTNDVIAFNYVAGTLYTGVDFGDVPENELLTDGQQSGLPGSILIYGHTFIAGSAGTVTFTTTKLSTPAIPGWNNIIYRDNNCNSQIDSGDTPVTGPISVVAEEKICLVVKEFIPAGAPFNAQDQVTIAANFTYVNATPALSAVATRVDLTTVGTPTTAGLSLLKAVDKASAAPGEVITYTITYLNGSSTVLSNIVIYDATPPYTTFLSATNGVMGSGLNSVNITTPSVGETGPVKWTFDGALAPAGTGNVIYKVTIE